jgi:hypothetical protein
MTKHEIEETQVETQSVQDQPELNEGELAEVAGGLTIGGRSNPKPAVDMF